MSKDTDYQCYSTIKFIINKDGFLQKKISPEMVHKYSSIRYNLAYYLNKNIQSQNSFLQIITSTLKVVRSEQQELSINLVIKKLIFLQFLIKWSSQNRLMTNIVSQSLVNEVNVIIKQDLSNLSKPKCKKSSSLQKIGTFLRSFSAKKQKSSSKMKLQMLQEKETVKEIVMNILQPYCTYLLKVIIDNDAYRSIIANQKCIYSNHFMWKLINWNSYLSKIILSLNKIGRYFGEDFIGVWILCCYLISQDESIYYAILKQNIEKEASKWLQRLQIAKKYYHINKKCHSSKILELFTSDQLHEIVNLKRQIDQTERIKQQLNFLYINSFLNKWKGGFKSLPMNIAKLNKQKWSSSDQLLSLIELLRNYKEFSSLFDMPQPVKIQHSLEELKPRAKSKLSDCQKSHQTTTNTEEQFEAKLQLLSKTKASNHLEKQEPRRSNMFTQKRKRILGQV